MIDLIDKKVGNAGRFVFQLHFPSYFRIRSDFMKTQGFSLSANTLFTVVRTELTLTVMFAILGFGIRIFVQESTFEENDNEVKY